MREELERRRDRLQDEIVRQIAKDGAELETAKALWQVLDDLSYLTKLEDAQEAGEMPAGEWLSIREAYELLGVSRRTLYRFLSRPDLGMPYRPKNKFGGGHVFRADELLIWWAQMQRYARTERDAIAKSGPGWALLGLQGLGLEDDPPDGGKK